MQDGDDKQRPAYRERAVSEPRHVGAKLIISIKILDYLTEAQGGGRASQLQSIRAGESLD